MRETPCRRNLEGDVSEGYDNGDPIIADEEEACFFFVGIIALRVRGRKQRQCRPRLWGRHLHGSW